MESKYKFVPVNMEPDNHEIYADAEMIVEVATKKILYGNWTHYPSHIGKDDLQKITTALNTHSRLIDALEENIRMHERFYPNQEHTLGYLKKLLAEAKENWNA